MANAAGPAGSAPPEVRAVARYVRVAPDKARQVIAHIRGLGADEARDMLRLSPKGVSTQILKTLDSAIANAEHNNGLDADELVVSLAYVDEGPVLRRYRPRALGRAYRIRKRTSHITIILAPEPEATVPAPPPPSGRAGRGRKAAEKAAGGTRATAVADTADTEDTPAEPEPQDEEE
jgi:large subunit ribosomal protein L22